MKFRKKPIIIEAEMFHSKGNIPEGVLSDHSVNPPIFYIETLEGRMIPSDGDWIITGIEGEKYPCKDNIFRATYERVEE